MKRSYYVMLLLLVGLASAQLSGNLPSGGSQNVNMASICSAHPYIGGCECQPPFEYDLTVYQASPTFINATATVYFGNRQCLIGLDIVYNPLTSSVAQILSNQISNAGNSGSQVNVPLGIVGGELT